MPCRAFLSAPFLALAMFLPLDAFGWNAAGHRLSVAVAWPGLSEPVKRKVDAILSAHPDAARWQAVGRSEWPGERLGEAAVWPDVIRRAERMRAERDGDRVDDERIHRDWHYLDWPIGGAMAEARGGQIDRQIERLSRIVADTARPAEERAIALAWLAHLVGDAHMPLHVATWRDEEGNWTAGGNGVAVLDSAQRKHPETNLHRFWDELPGKSSLRGKRLFERADALRSRHPPEKLALGSAIDWIRESHATASSIIPPPGPRPWSVDTGYRERAREIADRQIAAAGARLGALLEALLGP